MSKLVYLHLGSNMGDRLALLQEAEKGIVKQIGPIKKKSSYYETEPWGKRDQPHFINYAVLVETKLSAVDTLAAIHAIEEACGRQRTEKWTARLLDIDIVFYGKEVINNATLTIPHPHMHERNFVLIPIMEIAAEFVHPVLGLTVEELYDQSPDQLEVILMENS